MSADVRGRMDALDDLPWRARPLPRAHRPARSVDAHLPQPSAALRTIERFREGGRERVGFIGLDRNERLGPLPDAVVSEIRGSIDSALLTHYPSTDALYDEFSAALGVGREHLLLTAGSDAAVKALYQVYAEPGAGAVMLDPSYAMYPIYARMFGMEPRRVAFAENLSVDVDALLGLVAPGVRLVFIANPNQPTGTVIEDDVVEALIARAADHGALVVVDEAYYPFSERTVLPWITRHPNLVVTRTFSKAWGLAGVRLGVVAADPAVVRNLYKVRSAYDVNAFAATCAAVMLRHPEVATDYAAEVAAGRALLGERARTLGLAPVPGLTNFQLLRLRDGDDPTAIVEALHGRGYIVKGPFTAPGLQDCIRVTLGPPALMGRFADELAAAISGQS